LGRFLKSLTNGPSFIASGRVPYAKHIVLAAANTQFFFPFLEEFQIILICAEKNKLG
jgi:hypothetical protein